MATTCYKAECCLGDPFQGDFSGFSLVGGDFPGGNIQGNQESSFLVECPAGQTCAPGQYPVLFTYPENGSVTYPPPDDGGPITLRVPCPSGGDIVRELAYGTSQEEINRNLYEMFRECGQATADVTVNTAYVATLYSNTAIDPVTCDGLKFSAAPGGLLGFNDTTKYASLPSGAFTSYASQAAADAAAETYVATQIATFKSGGGQCGYWNTEQTYDCNYGDPETVAANTIFSAVSQADADAQALQQAMDACPQGCNATIDAWTWTPGGNMTGSGSGAFVTFSNVSGASGSFATNVFNSTPGMSCHLTMQFTVTQNNTLVYVQQASGGNLYYSGLLAVGTYNVSQAVNITSFATQLITLQTNGQVTGTFLMGAP